MRNIIKLGAGLMLCIAAGGTALAATTATAHATQTCRFEAADYNGPNDWHCLGTSCYAGWCCRICTQA